MRFLTTVFVLGALLLPADLATAQGPTNDAAQCVWPWLVGNIDADVPNVVAQTVANGQDAIYLHLYRTTGVQTGVLHMADEAGSFSPALGTIDPDVTLSAFIAQAHAANIQVIGVLGCFLDGGPLPGSSHDAHLLQVIDYLVHSTLPNGDPVYELDGIALDRVRFYSGLSNSPAAVENFVQQVKDLIAPLSIHAFLPANLWHIDGPPYNGSFRSYSESRGLLMGQFGHDWEALSLLLDVSMPMAYIADGGLYGNDHGLMTAYLQTVTSYATIAKQNAGATDLRILPAVRTWNDSSGTTSAASLGACIQGSLLGGGDGYNSYRYYTSSGHPSWWSTLASWTQSGAEYPIARLRQTSSLGLSVSLDASLSTTANPAALPLEYRFDLDGDGQADTPWSLSPTTEILLSQAGSRWTAVEVRDALGNRAGRHHKAIALNPTLALTGSLSTVSGGSVNLNISVGSAGSGHYYVVAGTLSGTSPGVSLAADLVVPLNPDPVTDIILLLANTSTLPGFIGQIDSNGDATAAMITLPGQVPPSLAWNILDFAAVGFHPTTGMPSFTTEAASLLIFP